MMYSLSKALAFSLDTPWEKLPETVRHAILYGLDGRKLHTTAAARIESEARRIGTGTRSASAESRAASSGSTAVIGSAAKPTPAWRSGLTR